LRRAGQLLSTLGALCATQCWLELDGLSGGAVDDASSDGSGATAGASGAAGNSGTGAAGGASGGGAEDASDDAGCSPGAECGLCSETCEGGSCTPREVASGEMLPFRPFRLAVAGDALFYIDVGADALFRVDGSGGPTKLTDASDAQSIASNGKQLFWGSPAFGIRRCTLPACADAFTFVDSVDSGDPYQLAADATHVYWITGPGLANGEVKRAEIVAQTVQSVASAQDVPAGIALGATHAFWTLLGTGSGNGAIMWASKAGGAPEPLVPGQESPTAIAATDSHLYWTSVAVPGKVFRCDLASSCASPEELSVAGPSPIRAPGSIAVDASRFYFTNDGDATVMSCNVAGCSQNPSSVPEVVAGSQRAPRGLVASSRCLFWSEGPNFPDGASRILALAKP
jgi:hypothetical protein